ncbi:hypothetical protein KDU71_01355 [Carboxylicivirga sediminis]|uniref:Uncharacterized protein n=1 Tax=Carboxylicivirga sediminis TaxID=2006564 RepID=A0A941IX20_9BACT|nr:hypothetical protein [Carboxylicivirga sediminis]MBR8534192.1 hypothetical protein [Carboxylicivirga sediminis]
MWHHEHWIEQTDNGTLMTDIVSYSPPFGILGLIANALFIKKRLASIFDYREKILTRHFSQVQVNV